MVTSFLRMQAASLDASFQSLIDLLNDPIAELHQFPESFDALFSNLLEREKILVFPSGKLAGWLVPESTEGQFVDPKMMDLYNDLALWNEQESCWNFHKILAFAKVDYDYCLVQVNLEAGSLALWVFSSACDLSRFWDCESNSGLDTESSVHYHNFSTSLASWLGMLSSGHFEASGQAVLNYSPSQTPMLDLIKQILINSVLFPELPFAEIEDPAVLAEQLATIAQQRAELAALQQEHEEDLANYSDEPLPVHCYKHFNESTDSLLLVRPSPLSELSTNMHVASEINELKGVTRKIKKLIRKFIERHPAKTDMPWAVLYFCPQPLTHAEIVHVALELGFDLGVDSKASIATQRKQKVKAEQSIQQTFFANGQMRIHNKEGNQVWAQPEPGREVFLSERVLMRNPMHNQTSILTRTLTEYGRQRVREMLRFEPFTFRSSQAGPGNLLELFCQTLLKHGRLDFTRLKEIWKQELNYEANGGNVTIVAKNAQKLGLIYAVTGRRTIYRIKKRRVRMIRDGPATPLPPRAEEPPAPVPEYVDAISACLTAAFEKERMLSASECIFVLTTGDYSAEQMREVLELMVERKWLYKLANPKSDAHDLYICRLDGQPDKLDFEYFYSLVKHLGLDEQQRRNFALHRSEAHKAWLSGDVITNTVLRTSLELITEFSEAPETAAVVVLQNVAPLANLGNGLFANVDLPEGLLIPVTGKQELDAETPDIFLPYGFKFQSFLPGRHMYAIDTCPEGEVTCWAGFINDARNTGMTNNAVQVCSNFEDRMYLKLTTAVPAGQQLFWDYGEGYWHEVDVREKARVQEVFGDIDVDLLGFDNTKNTHVSNNNMYISESNEFALPFAIEPASFMTF